MLHTDLRVLPFQGPLAPYQVYFVPELNAVMAFWPERHGLMPGKIRFFPGGAVDPAAVQEVWTGDAVWSQGRWGSEIDLRLGDETYRHLGYEETLRRVHAQANAETASGKDRHDHLLVPEMLQASPQTWLVRTSAEGGADGRLAGNFSVTCGHQVHNGWYEDRPGGTLLRLFSLGWSTTPLPAGSVFAPDGQWTRPHPPRSTP